MKKKTVCFVGNPNVGKSSLFNILTNKNQHTGNWTGKTVENEFAEFVYKDTHWTVVDLPGTYSLIGESKEEKIASEFVASQNYDLAVIIADSTNLERSMQMILEVLDITNKVIVVLNLIDEAQIRKIKINVNLLKQKLNVPIVLMSTKERKGIIELCEEMQKFTETPSFFKKHSEKIEHYFAQIEPYFPEKKRGFFLRCLTNEDYLKQYETEETHQIFHFYKNYISRIEIMESYRLISQNLLKNVINREEEVEKTADKRWTKFLTNKKTGIPFLFLLLFFLLWLTIYFSNIPSDILFQFFQKGEYWLQKMLSFLPEYILNPLIYGGYRTLYWVVSVMLPPMMIFFPLFAILEDYGLLPRIAFNLDKPFQKCGSCGKQSLTMCMGLGCNAVGVTGSRIMESRKMRILSILTNVFMPCNGRFPAMISVISMFFIKDHSILGSMYSAFILSLIIVFGIFLTFIITKLLSFFLLKDEKPMFLFEMPSFRMPKLWVSIKQAWVEKAFHVLKRAMIVSFPAGIFLYFLANTSISGVSIFELCSKLLNPFAMLIGLDGIILLAFILGLPANEIVIPIILLGYCSTGVLTNYESLESLKSILIQHGWTFTTALCFLIFSLCHFPCATTLLTIKKETNSWFYTILAFFIPTLVGITICFFIHLLG